MAIIVPLEGAPGWIHRAERFCVDWQSSAQPEDFEVEIIYSFLSTPENAKDPPSPRRICRQPFRTDTRVHWSDVDWRETIERLRGYLSKGELGNPRGATKVLLVDDEERTTWTVRSLPSEVVSLLRAAFKGSSKVEVRPANHGLSGAMCYFAQPFDPDAIKTQPTFVKVFPDNKKAYEEYARLQNEVKPYLEGEAFVQPDLSKWLQGVAYSIWITEIVRGPGGKSTSLGDVVRSKRHNAEQFRHLVREALSRTDVKGWQPDKGKVERTLLEEYLGSLVAREGDADRASRRRQILESEDGCHNWFSGLGVSVLERMGATFPKLNATGWATKRCHGDFHLENVMVRKSAQSVIPVLIDFSRAGTAHVVRDCVTLEVDLVVRGLGGVRKLADVNAAHTWLTRVLRGAGVRRDRMGRRVSQGSTQEVKVAAGIREARRHARIKLKTQDEEYAAAAMLRALEIVSYGNLSRDELVRAVGYINYQRQQIGGGKEKASADRLSH